MSDFVTKDSGERQTFASGMQRDSAQKELRPDLIYGPMLIRWAELMGRGAIKYGERNWEKGNSQEELNRARASAFRHFVQWFYGLNKEEDHAAATFFNMSQVEFLEEKLSNTSSKETEEFLARQEDHEEKFYRKAQEIIDADFEEDIWLGDLRGQ